MSKKFLSRDEILGLLSSLEEDEEVLVGNDDDDDVSRSIVVDRRAEQQEVFDAMCNTSLPFFARYVLGIKVAPHHQTWSKLILKTIDLAERSDRVRATVCVLAPRDHGKSAWFSYALPLWLSTRVFPGEYGAMVGEGDVSLVHLKHVKQGTPNRDLPGIMNTPALQHLRRSGAKGWTAELIELTNGSEIFAKGAKAAWRGKHPRWLVVDDLLSQDCLFSPTERKRALEKLTSELLPMVRGPVFIVGTPLHQEDIYAYCRRQKAFSFVEFPALSTDPDTGEEKSLWPDRFTVEQLHHIRDKEVGQIVFSREYMCKAISSLSSLFPEELFVPPVLDDTFRLRPPRNWVLEKCSAGRFISLDIGISANIGSDYTVILVIGLDEQGNRYILDIIRERGLGFQKIISTFISTGARYAVDAGIIESNQAQAFVGNEAMQQSPFPIDTYQTGSEKHLWTRGVPGLRLLLENQKFRFPRGNRESIEKTSILISELQSHTLVDGKVQSTSRHNDTVMALWFTELLLRRMSFGGAFFDEDEDDAGAVEEYWGEEDAADSYEGREVGKGFRPEAGADVPTGDELVAAGGAQEMWNEAMWASVWKH